MAKYTDDDGLWTNILLKKCSAIDLQNTLTVCDNGSERKYQLFEVLVTETLARLYKDFEWKTSPIQHDGGVDFIAEKKMHNMNGSGYFPQLIIYGQVKRRNTSISEKLVLDATSNIIRYYRQNAIQEKCLYEIIHVFSSDKKIIKEIEKSIKNIDQLHYCVRIINAKYLFQIWCLNKNFVHSIIDSVLSKTEIALLDNYIEKNKTSWNSLLNFRKAVKRDISVGQTFECMIEIDCSLEIAFAVKVKWVPADGSSILLVSPQMLLNSSPFMAKSINNKIIFEIQLFASNAGKQDLGILQFISPFNQLIYQMPLGEICVRKLFNPSFCEVPVSSVMKELRSVLLVHNSRPCFYVVTGEGGIGKSKVLEQVRIFAINQRYRTINIEHTCNWENDRYILYQIFGFLCECQNSNNTGELYRRIRQSFGGFYKESWDCDLINFLHDKKVRNDDMLIECLFNLFLYALENDSLCITISNMHWASSSLLSILKLLIEYINDNRFYLSNKIMIIFEGRSEEKIHVNYQSIIPYDWIDFCNYKILKKINLNKWTTEDSNIYIRSLFIQPKTLIENDELKNMQKLLLKYSSGNPMHINEMIQHLISEKSLTINEKGKLHILVTDTAAKFSNKILDVILLRIQYFIEEQPQIMDYLIILANLVQEDYLLYSQVIHDIFQEMNVDGTKFFRKTGFLDLKNNIYRFAHEHYKTLLMKQPVYNSNSVETFLFYAADRKKKLTGISKIRLMLLKDNKGELYMETVFDELVRYLKCSDNSFEQYSLLQLAEYFPVDILQNKGYPLHKIYRFLIDGAMVLVNYNEAKKYIKKINEMDASNEEYYLNMVYSKKMLSNINGLQMEMDNAISVGLDSISALEHYLSISETDDLRRECILLYDRVAIEYYMSGQYTQCDEYHSMAQRMLNQFEDSYVKYHLLYEQGIRELHTDIRKGIRHIQDSLKNIPIYDFMTEGQEKDLILGDLLMGKLLDVDNEEQIIDIKNQTLTKCNELATSKEPFESILFHWIAANCFILQKDYKEAIRYFRISVIISAKTAIAGTLWKSYLNLAQAYLLIGCQESNLYNKSYKETARYYILEAKEIIENALQCNVWTKDDFERRLSYPLSLIDKLLGFSDQIDTKFKNNAPLHIDYEQYSFFMLD